MSVNASNQTPILKTNHTNNSLLKRDEKNRIARLLSNIIGRDGVWVRHKATRIEIGLRDEKKDIHFLVIRDSENPDDQVDVSGGWWAYYTGTTRTQVDLSDGGAGTITDYSDYTAGISVTASGFIYVELDKSAGTLTAKFGATIPADAASKYRKKIASVTWDSDESRISAIKQDWTGGNILTETELENDHSWHYDVPSNTITQGKVWQGDDSATEKTLTGFDSTPNTTTSITYYIKVDWSSSHISPTVSWTDSVTETEADDDEIVLYRVISFDSNDVPTEHLQGDLHLPEVFTPKPPSRDCVLWFDTSDNKFKYTATTPQAYMVVQYTAGSLVDFDYPRFNAAAP